MTTPLSNYYLSAITLMGEAWKVYRLGGCSPNCNACLDFQKNLGYLTIKLEEAKKYEGR